MLKADAHLALLDHRNTPTDQTGTSPSQWLFGRRTRTLLPLSPELLKPESHHNVTAKLRNSQTKHAEYYNKMAKPLKPLHPGDTIRMKLPGEEQWSLGACKRQVDTRSYLVECQGRVYRRNRRQLRSTSEDLREPNDYEIEAPVEGTDEDHEGSNSEVTSGQAHGDIQASDDHPTCTASPEIQSSTRVSSHGRVIKPPKCYIEEMD